MAHRYWRFRNTTGSQGNGGFFSCATLQFFEVISGADLALGNAGIQDAIFSAGFEGSNAFDNKNSTYFFAANNTPGHWFGVDFGAGVTHDLVQFTFRIEPSTAVSGPKDIWVDFSDDNITWTNLISFAGLVWTAGQVQTFNVAAPPAAEIRAVAADTLVAARLATVEARLSLANALVALNYPAAFERVSQVQGLVTVKQAISLRVSNSAVLVAVKGRTANPKLRAWTFSLDGHDFYVLRLGTMGTLVYDLYSQQWMDWDAFSEIYWPVNVGFNWVDGQGVTDSAGNVFGSNVLVGDDTYPLLWILEPEQPYDASPDGPLDPQQEYFFPRIVQGQLPVVGREAVPCYVVWLTTDMGDPAYVGAGVQLEISDDAGKSYDDMGTVTVTPGATEPQLSWYSLGQVEAPGRLFRITDDGAVMRIDNMEMNDPDDSEKK